MSGAGTGKGGGTGAGPKPTEQLPFEDALRELEAAVAELERGDGDLEQSLQRFERGMALARRCEDRLNEAEAKVAILLKEGTRLVEVDAATGETRSERELPGDEVEAAGGEGEEDEEESEEQPRGKRGGSGGGAAGGSGSGGDLPF
jgi:exodeoxyribonuclease VII small subunit